MKIRVLYIPIVLVIAFGYVVFAAALLLAGGFSGSVNLIVRSVEVLLLLFVVLLCAPSARFKNTSLFPLIVFFVIYGFRLSTDVIIYDILMIYQSQIYVLGYFFGLTFLSVAAIFLYYRPQDLRAVFRSLFHLVVLANILLFLYAVWEGDFGSGVRFSGRVQADGEMENSAVLGPIWFGVLGSMLAAMIFGMLAAGGTTTKVPWNVGICLMVLATANIFFSASRGPVLALFLSIIIFLLRPGASVSGTGSLAARGKGWMLVLVLSAIVLTIIKFSGEDNFLIERMTSLYSERIASPGGWRIEERDIVYAVAWQDFLSSPILGSSYVVSYENSSPHNIILESLISTGIFGTIFFAWALIRAGRSIFRLWNGVCGAEGMAIAQATVVCLLVGLTSFTINQSPQLWIMVALATVIGARVSRRERDLDGKIGNNVK
jgi:hypothetical protein